VSKEAASEAKEVILHERPRYVLLELDKVGHNSRDACKVLSFSA